MYGAIRQAMNRKVLVDFVTIPESERESESESESDSDSGSGSECHYTSIERPHISHPSANAHCPADEAEDMYGWIYLLWMDGTVWDRMIGRIGERGRASDFEGQFKEFSHKKRKS